MDVLPPRLPKRRLLVIVVLEVVLVVALLIATWRIWESRQAPAAAVGEATPAATTPAPTTAATPIPLPPDGATAPPSAAPAGPADSDGAAGLLAHLQQFNGLVSTLETTETDVLSILIPGTVWYLQNVVVPRVEAALGR